MQLSRPEIVGTFGAASSSHWIASQCAMRILERGGNAFDAAAAAGFVLQVVAPHLNGPGGDVAALLHRASDRSSVVLCGQGPVPAAATIARMQSFQLDLVPGTGLLPAVVPGAFDAWMLMLRDYGRLAVEDVLESAIHYAEHGIPVSERLQATLGAASGLFRRYWPASRELFLPGDHVPAVDTLFRNRPLAATLRRLVLIARSAGGDRVRGIEAARQAWSRGFVAEAIDRFCRREVAMDVTGRANPALLTGDDLAHWSAAFEAPVSLDFAGWRIVKCGPWTQGPALLQTLALLDAGEMAELDPNGAEFVHRVVEAMKLAFADRELFYGDPGAVEVPIRQLLSVDYSHLRRQLIGSMANNEWRPGALPGFTSSFDYEAAAARVREGGLLSAYGGGEPTVGEVSCSDYLASVAGDTCHLDVVDEDGNMVSATPSGGWLQSSPGDSRSRIPAGYTRADEHGWMRLRPPRSSPGGGRVPH
jgi:gamma-glutamyltranspeptidase / glutathione hydrolase